MTTRNDAVSGAKILPVLAALTVLCLAGAAALTLLAHDAAPVAAPAEQLSLVAQRIPFEAQNALRGEASAFDALNRSAVRLKALRGAAADKATGTPAGGGAVTADSDWRKLNDGVTAVSDARSAVETIQVANQEARELAPKLLSELGDLVSSVGAQKLDGMSRYVDRFELMVQRIQQDLNGLASGVSDAAPAAQRLADSLEFLNQVMRGLSGEESGLALAKVTGADAEARLKIVVARNQQYAASVRKAIASAEALSKAQAAARALPAVASSLEGQLGATPARESGIRADSGASYKAAVLSLLGLATLLLAALGWTSLKSANVRRNSEVRVRENERNQEAIMRLLDELSSLADGDLTVQATVTEDITGAIADSINYAIEALRELVTTINDSAIQLEGATKQTQAAAAHMAKASSAQSRQISSASESMVDMAASIEEVSGNSERCSDVARHSVDIAHKGGDAVRRTIDGMNAIRETIQETSKRIKRLGESSQEIGNIVELINDIAEQTNILALNASIQASMAGEAGRGFAVVADEVQRLAERAANATKQIEVLVRTIQTDTNEAVVSMERSTTDVVGGALLAENAGAALEEIEQVSNQIASLVQNISASARQQAVASGNISKNMQVVREISAQTAEGSTATSTSIAKLAALSAQLRKSVAGFRLPDYGGGTTTIGGTSARLPALKETANPAPPERCAKQAASAPEQSDASGMTDISSQTLHIVAKELNATLGDARASLEGYAERTDQRALLEKCADQLHCAHGVLRLVEVYGAALLAEEMEHVTRYLLSSGNDQKRQVDGLDALMRAMVQLPTYLERVLSGGRDLALVLLPLLNDLRSVRGSPLLSEGTLLLLNLKSDQPAQPQSQRQGDLTISVAQWARRLRPRFQIGLLGYIRGERTVQNLEILAKVAEKLEQVATTQPVFQLWWVTGAILEAVRANGLEGSATLKRLLGQADRQIKALYEQGEARYCEDPPVDLLNNLLYYVARATTAGGRIAAVRASFKLSELLPVDDTIEQERESLSAPSVKLMRTVAAAIKEDLSKVKDVLDIFVRRGGGRTDELIPQLELLKKISDTLGVLGLGELRERVQQEIADLSEIVTDGKTPPEEALVKVAGVLLSVEDSLDDQLVRLILPNASTPEDLPADQDTEFKLVSEAVLRECIVNLARIKEAVSIAVQKPADFPSQGLDNVPQLLRGITAGLLMLGKGRAVELMDAIGMQVRKLIEPGAPPPDAARLERVADAIVSIEYYMETLQNGRNDPWYMLDNAEMCIKALAEQAPTRVPNLNMSSSEAAKTVKIDPIETVALDRAPPIHAATNPLIAVPAPEAVDPQFVELFIEEAKEEIASIQNNFPLWDQNPMDVESLSMLRRSFHTLKGSGRMVGARAIAEFGWAIENLLNRIIDKTLSRTPGMMLVLRNSVAALPALVEQLETGRNNPGPVEALMARAFAYADGRDPEQSAVNLAPEDRGTTTTTSVRSTVVPQSAGPAPAGPAALGPAVAARQPGTELSPAPAPAIAATVAAQPQPQPPAMDPMLHEIYSKETSSHLSEIRDYLRKRTGQPAPHELPESVYRAIHTLSGSSKMAEARHGIRITEPLNRLMRKVFDSGHGLSDLGLATLSDAVRAIDNVVSHINEASAFFSEQPLLLGRLHALETELDAALARDASDASASAIVPVITAAEGQAAAPPAPTVAQVVAPPEPEVASAPAPAAAAPATAPASVPAEDFDHEIANIYCEETTELLEAAEASLTAWNRDRKDKEWVTELQRQLHTLKGGARMAGISAMGDLSHELETLVIQIDGGSVVGDDDAHAVMQASLDELARMRDSVSNGILPPKATALTARIRDLATQARAPSLTPVAPAKAPAPAPAPEIAPATAPVPAIGLSSAPAPAPAVARAPAAVLAPAAVPAPVSSAPPPPVVAQSPVAPSHDEPEPVAALEDSAAIIEQGSAPVLPGRESAPAERVEMARVDADLLDTMLNNAGEVSIFRARLDQQINSIDFNLAELARTVTRLKEQLRGLEIETETQVLNRHQDTEPRRNDFDPLELDRYSSLQQYSRALAETSGDVASIQVLLETLTREAQNLLTQQSRVITELQNSLMRTRMVPFQRHVQRLTRLVRQAANDTGKRAELVVEGAAAELDRQMLERMVAPLEHMLRNAVVHGIEAAERRAASGKPEIGRISVSLERDGAEIVIVVADDGAGISVKLIRDKAIALGLIDPQAKLTDEEALQLILEPGFSTAGHVTQAAGRGVGMDVVATEVKKLGGGLFIDTTPGKGSRFTIRLPFTLAISQALIVRVAEEVYALPLATVEGVVRLPRNIVSRHLGRDAPLFEYGGQKYRFQQLGSFVGLGATRLPEADVSISVVLIRAGEHSTALVTDELVGSREIVVKSLGPQISGIRGIAGATILGDGRIVIILDMGSLVRSEWRARPTETAVLDQRDRRTFALVVDDSITVRRVTQRLLERNGMRVLTAKDGVDAVSMLQEHSPDIILLDIEMPRMDGYEVAAHVRNDPRLRHIPIVMITSRVSEKHRARAIELGVDDYLGKPYQESQLLDAIEPLVNRRSAVAR